MSRYYILLPDHSVRQCSLREWSEWVESSEKTRVVRQSAILDYWISTVFLGLDHGFAANGKPVLFETMIFARIEPGEPGAALGPNRSYRASEEWCRRATTYEDAEEIHRIAMGVVVKWAMGIEVGRNSNGGHRPS